MKTGIRGRRREPRRYAALQASLGLLAAIELYPIVLMISTAMKTGPEILANPYSLPSALSLANFAKAWRASSFGVALANSFLMTSLSIVGVVTLGSLASYPLARRSDGWHKAVYLFFVALIIVPFQMTMIPLYRSIQRLGWVNSYHSVILTDIAIALPFSIFLFTGFIKFIPREIDESGFMDGCRGFTIFLRLIFPLMKPVTATVVILNTVGLWNDFLTPLLFLQKREMRTVTTALFAFQGQYNTDWSLLFSAVTISMAPLVLLFLSMQKNFIKGISAGAVKG